MLNFYKKLSVEVYILLAMVFYIIWQISLSGAILSAETSEQTQLLSNLAKVTVGFGSALFVFRLLYEKRKIIHILILSVAAGFFAMEAEDAIIDHLASNTTAEERLEAKQVLVFSSAQVTGKVVLNALPDSIASNDVKLKTFSKILGFVIWQEPTLIKEIANKIPELVTALFGQEIYNKIDLEYDRYVEKYQLHVDEYVKVKNQVENFDFARASYLLNTQLARYATCKTSDCQNEVSKQVNWFLGEAFPELPVALNLENFCKEEVMSERYVLGQAVGGIKEKKCAVSEHGLYEFVQKEANKVIQDFLVDANIPQQLIPSLLSEKMLTLEEWRKLLAEYAKKEITEQVKSEFSMPQQYAEDGTKVEEGKSYAVAIFLPPVALGFSLTVCFLHFATLLITLTRKTKICSAIVACLYIMPVFFSKTVPLTGFIGIYAEWLMYWENLLYPFGVFRNIIL